MLVTSSRGCSSQVRNKSGVSARILTRMLRERRSRWIKRNGVGRSVGDVTWRALLFGTGVAYTRDGLMVYTGTAADSISCIPVGRTHTVIQVWWLDTDLACGGGGVQLPQLVVIAPKADCKWVPCNAAPSVGRSAFSPDVGSSTTSYT